MAVQLSESQLARIAENKAKALAIAAVKKKEKEEYARLLAEALRADVAGDMEAQEGNPDDGALLCEPAAGSAQDPYLAASTENPAMDLDSMDEGTENEDGDGDDEGKDHDDDEDDGHGGVDGALAAKARGSYSTISSRHAFVQRFFASGTSETEFQEMNPTISVSTLEKWVSACGQVAMQSP